VTYMLDSLRNRIVPDNAGTAVVDLCTMVPGYVNEFRPLAANRSVAIRLDYPQDIRLCACLEISGFEKVIQNLMENAIRYAKTAIDVRVFADVDKNGRRIVIAVSDDGVPIPSANVARLFEPGWRDPNSPGYGLGLAYVREYMESSGGTVSVNNENGKEGKTFSLAVPLVAERAEFHADEKRPCLLVVEDNDDLRTYLSEILADEYSVIEIASWREVFERLKGKVPPDMILMDRMLGDHDGIEILKEIQRTLELQSLPLVFLSGLAGSNHRIEALELGAADYLAKPFDIEELRIRLRTILRRDQVVIQAFKERVMNLGNTPREHRVGSLVRLMPNPNERESFYRLKGLTPREIEVAEEIILKSSVTNKEIAHNLEMSEQTVKNHLGKIFEKTHIERREEIKAAILDETRKGDKLEG